MLGPDQSSKINDPSNVSNQRPTERDRKRVLKPEERDKFLKVYGKDTDSEKKQKKKTEGKDEDGKKSPSLFDLSAQKVAEKKQFSKEGEEKGSGFEQFAKEQPDYSGVNPFAQDTGARLSDAGAALSKVATDPPPQRTSLPEMKILIEKIASTIELASAKGEQNITITLKHPPLFEGSKLTITTYDVAKGEFNVKFEGLKMEAKQLLDLPENKLSFKQGLEERGFTLHILTATTYEEKIQGDFKGATFTRGEKEEQEQKRDDQQEENQDA